MKTLTPVAFGPHNENATTEDIIKYFEDNPDLAIAHNMACIANRVDILIKVISQQNAPKFNLPDLKVK